MKDNKLTKNKVYLALALGLVTGLLGYTLNNYWGGTGQGASTPPARNQIVADEEKTKSPPPASAKQDDATTAPTATIAQETGTPGNSTGALSNTRHGWGIKPNQEHRQPEMPQAINTLLARYDAYWLGDPAEKVLYLTFDEGYENGYTPKILDILKENDVKAAFFVTGHYIKSQPELVQRMAKEGHIVGNHTDTHPSLPDISEEQIAKELQVVEQSFARLTGQQSMSYLRPPKGEYSERTLAVTRKLGYHNIFWSLAMVDWVPMPGGPDQAYQGVMDHLHNGAVILLHAVSQDNTEALDRILKDIKKQGYEFKTLDHLVGK